MMLLATDAATSFILFNFDEHPPPQLLKNTFETIKHRTMNLMKLFLALTLLVFVNLTAEAKVIKASTLADAIAESNLLNGKDSLYLSDFDINSIAEGPKQYSVTDQLVLINDLGAEGNILKDNVLFKVALTGTLDLKGFDFSNINSRVINLGKVTLEDCTFVEGKDLTAHFNNKGLFEIKNGEFRGSEEGLIIRTAYFKVGAKVIL